MCILAAVSRAGYYRFCSPPVAGTDEESRGSAMLFSERRSRAAITAIAESLVHCEPKAGKSITSGSRA